MSATYFCHCGVARPSLRTLIAHMAVDHEGHRMFIYSDYESRLAVLSDTAWRN